LSDGIDSRWFRLISTFWVKQIANRLGSHVKQISQWNDLVL
jgi:hypothetical protein